MHGPCLRASRHEAVTPKMPRLWHRSGMTSPDERILLFVYASFLSGEPEHSSLDGAELVRAAMSAPKYHLYELGPLGALVEGGTTAVAGELYLIDLALRCRLDRKRELGVLFDRGEVELEDGSRADAYFMPADRVRGKRRVRGGDWKRRFGPGPGGLRAGPFVSWARSRTR